MIKAKLFKITEYDKENELKGIPFYLQDIYSLMDKCNLGGCPILELDPYEFNNNPNELKESLKELNNYIIGASILIISSSYASTKEFSEDEYYLYDKDYVEGKKKLPLTEILDRQNKILEEAGFTNINKYCGLECQEPYIWPNNYLGEKVLQEYNIQISE